jgi:hypothetical protein
VSDYDGIPSTTGVSHALVSDEYVITVTPAAGDVFSVKFEQGDIATKHEVSKSGAQFVLNSYDYGLVGDADLATGSGTNNRDAFQAMLDDAVKGTTIQIGNAVLQNQTFLIDGDLDITGKEGVTIEPVGRVEILHTNGRLKALKCPRFTFGPKFVMRGLAKNTFDTRQGSNRNTYSQSLYTNGGAGGGLELVLSPQSTVNDNDWSYFIKAITSDGSYISWFNNNRFNHNRVSIHPIIKTPFPDSSLVNDHQNICGNVFGNHYEGHCISSRYNTNAEAADPVGFLTENASNTILTNVNKFETYSGSGLSVDDHPYDIWLLNTASTKIQSDVMVVGGGVYINGIRNDVTAVKQYDIGTKELITLVGDGKVDGCEQYYSVNSGGDDFESAFGKTGIVVSSGTITVEGNKSYAGNGVRTNNANNSLVKSNELYSSDTFCFKNAGGTVDFTSNKLRTFDTAEYYDVSDGTGFIRATKNQYDQRDVAGSVLPSFNPNRIIFNEDVINAPQITIPGNNELRASSKTMFVTASANIVLSIFEPANPIDLPFDEINVYFQTSGSVGIGGNITTKTGATVNISANSMAKFVRYNNTTWHLVY